MKGACVNMDTVRYDPKIERQKVAAKKAHDSRVTVAVQMTEAVKRMGYR
jgi:hypothetical protein